MKKLHITLAAATSCLLFSAAALPRQAEQGAPRGTQPRFLNTQVEQRPATGSLTATFAAVVRDHQSAAWVAYSVPATPGDHGLCDADRLQRIYLEGRPARAPTRDQLEPAGDLLLLFRVQNSKVQRLRVASTKCEVDAGGLPVVWLTGPTAAESVALLRGTIKQADAGVREETAVMAIALHADATAGRVLEELAAPGQPTSLRKRAVFWLGVGRGDVETLVRLARVDESLDIRKEAMFWLSRSQDPRAIAFTEEVLRK